MKKILLFALVASWSLMSNAQILISSHPKDTLRDKSAVLEVKSNNLGLLLPRMSSTQRRAIVNPAPGLVVFDTTKQMFYGFVKETGWRPFLMGYDTLPVLNGISPSVIDNEAGDQLGYSVAINGNIAVASAPSDNINGKVSQGSLYVFRYDGENWTNIQKIVASDGAANDIFGGMVSMTKDFVFVAAPLADIGENADQGAVYVYKIQGDSLSFFQKIIGSNASAGDGFGLYVTGTGNQLFVGACNDDVGANLDQGSAYYFSFEGSKWVEKQKIIQDSAAATEDHFGYGISIDSNFVSIGGHVNTSGNYGYGQNSVFIYEKVNGLWQRRQKLLQPDQPGATNKTDAFGYATYLKGDNLVIGAWLRDEPVGNKDRGVIYQFNRSGSSWTYTNKFYPGDPNPGDIYGDYFGQLIRADDKYLLSGSGYEDIASGNIDKGGVYIYEWVNNSWQQKRKIISPTPTQTDFFAHRFAINNGNIIISASAADGNKGKIYFYTVQQ